MKILAFESSCDETAVAVVEDGRKSFPTPLPLKRICTLCMAVGAGDCLP